MCDVPQLCFQTGDTFTRALGNESENEFLLVGEITDHIPYNPAWSVAVGGYPTECPNQHGHGSEGPGVFELHGQKSGKGHQGIEVGAMREANDDLLVFPVATK